MLLHPLCYWGGIEGTKKDHPKCGCPEIWCALPSQWWSHQWREFRFPEVYYHLFCFISLGVSHHLQKQQPLLWLNIQNGLIALYEVWVIWYGLLEYSSHFNRNTSTPACSCNYLISLWQCIKSCRYRLRASINIQIKHQNGGKSCDLSDFDCGKTPKLDICRLGKCYLVFSQTSAV